MKTIFNECEIHRIYKKGEVIYYDKTPAHGLFFIKSGTVKIVTTDISNKELILKLSTTNDLLGFGFFTPEKIHMNTAKAIQDTQCSFLGTAELKKLMTENTDFNFMIHALLGKEIQDSQNKCRDLIRKNVRQRLATFFHDMAGHHSEMTPESIRIKVQLSREEIASIIGTANETVIRFISEFKDCGLIQEEEKFFHVLKPEEIRTISLGEA